MRRAVDDFRFPLMRHWSVYDAIVHSRYVAVRLGTWQDKGRARVDELLCRMGFSQRDAKQDYCARALPALPPAPACASRPALIPSFVRAPLRCLASGCAQHASPQRDAKQDYCVRALPSFGSPPRGSLHAPPARLSCHVMFACSLWLSASGCTQQASAASEYEQTGASLIKPPCSGHNGIAAWPAAQR
jgi:hypothetical protein